MLLALVSMIRMFSFRHDDERTLVVAFAGTASTVDAFTNVQTFEPADHSHFFDGGRKNQTVQGSLHRGFLNAYSRVK